MVDQTIKAQAVTQGSDPLSLFKSEVTKPEIKQSQEASVYKGPQVLNDNYIDQVRQTKQVSEVESAQILEPGEVIVFCLDKIKEVRLSNAEGRIIISNYRVSSLLDNHGSSFSSRRETERGRY